MKVCAVTTWPPHRDGVALYSSWLYDHLADSVHVMVIANISEKPYLRGKRVEERGVLRCWKRGSYLYPLHIFRCVSRERPDIIHLQHGWLLYGNIIASSLFPILLLIIRLCCKRLVVTMHTIIKRDAHIHGNPLVNTLARVAALFVSRFIIKVSDRVIVHNDLMKRALKRGYIQRGEESKIVVIPHGVKKPGKGTRQPGEDEGVWVLYLGFIRKSKGLEHLIKAFERLLKHCPDAKLVVVGGSHAHDRKDYVKALKHALPPRIRESILFTGFVSEKDLDELIWKSDVVVLQSSERNYVEASGALCRVAGYSKPVICSRVPKFQGELVDGEDCVMTNPFEVDELAQALISLTKKPELRKRLGEKLRERFKGNHWQDVARRHLELYQSLLKPFHRLN